MTRKSRSVLLAVMIVFLIYLLTLVIVTRPSYEDSMREKMIRAMGESPSTESEAMSAGLGPSAGESAQTGAFLSEEDARRLIREEIQAASALMQPEDSEIDIDEIASAVSDKIRADIAADVLASLPAAESEPDELTLDALKPFMPEIADTVYPTVLSRVVDTFSDSRQLQKAVIDWMVDNRDELIEDMIAAVVRSNELSGAVYEIMVANADSLAPYFADAMASDSSDAFASMILDILQRHPEVAEGLLAQMIERKDEFAAAIEPQLLEKVIALIPKQEVAPSADSTVVSAASEPEPAAASEPAAAPEPAAVPEATIAAGAAEIEEPDFLNQLMEDDWSTHLFSERSEAVKLTDEEYAMQQAGMKQSVIEGFLSRLQGD